MPPIGILPFRDDSGTNAPPEFLERVGQEFWLKMTLAHENVQALDAATPRVRVFADEPAMSQPNDFALGPDGGTVYGTEVERGCLVSLRVDRPGREWGRGR